MLNTKLFMSSFIIGSENSLLSPLPNTSELDLNTTIIPTDHSNSVISKSVL